MATNFCAIESYELINKKMFGYIKKTIPNKSSRRWFWFVMIILLSFYPYKLANAYYPFIVSNIQTIFFVSLILITIFILTNKRIRIPKPISLIAMIMIIGCLFSFFVTGHKYYYHKLIILAGALVLILIVYNKIGMRPFFIVYNRWILIMSILGVLGFALALSGIAPISTFVATEDERLISSWIITFTKQSSPNAGFIRYAGFFDEPGAMGYWGVFALVINKLFIKDQKLEIFLIISLLFTFSMGFYVQIVFFLIMSLLGKNDSFVKKTIWIFMIIGSIVILNSTKGTKYNHVYEATIERFEQASTGGELMEGTSREKLTNDTKEIFYENPWLGIGWPIDDREYFGDNPYETLAHDGIIGTIYLYFPFLLLLYWSIVRRDYELFAMVVFMAVGFMHRPFHFNYLTFFIFYSIPLMYYQEIVKKNKKNSKKIKYA